MKHGPAAYNHHFTLVALVAAIGWAFDDGQCLAGDAPCAAPPAGLVACWTGESNALDRVGGNTGTLLGGASYSTGKVGQAFSFNGSSGCMHIPYSSSLASPAFSVEAWVKPTAQVSDAIDQELIFGQSFGQWQLSVRRGTTGVFVAFFFRTAEGSYPGVVSANQIPVNDFSHLVGTWDGAVLKASSRRRARRASHS